MHFIDWLNSVITFQVDKKVYFKLNRRWVAKDMHSWPGKSLDNADSTAVHLRLLFLIGHQSCGCSNANHSRRWMAPNLGVALTAVATTAAAALKLASYSYLSINPHATKVLGPLLLTVPCPYPGLDVRTTRQYLKNCCENSLMCFPICTYHVCGYTKIFLLQTTNNIHNASHI